MKSWKICLLVFVGSSSFAQPIDLGYISLTLSEKNIRIPIERISLNDDNEISIKAYGHITEPTRSTIIFSLVLQDFSTDHKDINMKKCWLSFEQKNDDREGCYLSFGFDDPYAFYSSQMDLMNDVRKVVANATELSISKIENQNNRLIVTGDFASSHSDQRDGSSKSIKIQDGHFTLLVEGSENTTAAVEEYSGELNTEVLPYIPEDRCSSTIIESSLPPTYYFIVSQPSSSPPTEEEPPTGDPRPIPPPEPTPYFPPSVVVDNNPPSTPPTSDNHREIRTGRGPLDSNPAPATNSENNSGTRDSGVRRERR